MNRPSEQQTEQLQVRPYARLLTMLGEQLIKNDRVALVELIKNSYDADATAVRVSFDGLNSRDRKVMSVVLADNGSGMTEEIIRKHWLNPATPTKLVAKVAMPTTPLGRVMQGEKGIGRFAMFKIASTARVVTRADDSADEFVIDFDLSFLDQDANSAGSPEFIDQIQVKLTRRVPEVFDGSNPDGLESDHGTRIELTGLRANWTPNAIRGTFKDVQRLRPLVPPPSVEKNAKPDAPFNVLFQADGRPLPFDMDSEPDLGSLLENRARFRVEGIFDATTREFLMSVNGDEYTIPLDGANVRALRTYKKYFTEEIEARPLTCGSFNFAFYVFDLLSNAPDQFRLENDEKALVKSHRIYLYRDGVRVLPYGDAQDDWLQLDVIRGTQRADQVLSNDQTVGFVYIRQSENPQLRDKTNREGLLEEGDAYADFVAVLQVAVAYIRRQFFGPYLEAQKLARVPKIEPGKDAEGLLKRTLAETSLPAPVSARISEAVRALKQEKNLINERIERLEDLAGVGLSVETASHDIVASGSRALRLGKNLGDEIAKLKPAQPRLEQSSHNLIELLAFVASRLQDVQGLFVSTRQPPRALNVSEFAQRVQRIYSNALDRQAVRVEVEDRYAELVVKTTDAALLQLLINLFDNSLYWLESAQTASPTIRVEIDSSRNSMIFADNGPGVQESDEKYIFEPFYSGKDEDGKGLGLYIARQVGSRSGFKISLVTKRSDRVLPGANFLIQFSEPSK